MDILTTLYNLDSLKRYCKYLCKEKDCGLWEDLLSTCILIVYEKSNKEPIKDIVNYTMSVIHNEFSNKYSSFNKGFSFFNGNIIRIDSVNLLSKAVEDSSIDCEYEIAVKVMDADLKKEIKANRYPAGDKLFKAYLELKTYRNVSQKYGIPVMTCHRIITNYKKRINEAIR